MNGCPYSLSLYKIHGMAYLSLFLVVSRLLSKLHPFVCFVLIEGSPLFYVTIFEAIATTCHLRMP